MKLLLLTLTIAVLSQCSLAGPLQRSKRSEKFLKEFEEIGILGKRVIPKAEIVLATTLLKIPNEAAYQTYRHDIENYLEEVKTYKSRRGECYKKTMEIIGELGEVLSHIDEDDVPEEADKVYQWYLESGGDVLHSDLKQWLDLFEKSNFEHEMERLTGTELTRVQGMIGEVC